MATGIPGSKRRHTGYWLEYEGKAEYGEIMSMKSAELENILSIEGEYRNKLIYGDNLSVLRSLLEDKTVTGKVRLIYIDPPYATNSRFESRKQSHAYNDMLSGAEYLEFLRQRLILMRELLADNGSIYVHLDDNMAFPVKVMMDEIFGPNNFRNWITRKKSNPKNYTRKQFGNVSDYILFYTKSNQYVWNQPFEDWTDETSKKEYSYIEEGTGRRYKKVPIHAPGTRNGETGKPWKGMLPPPGKHWQYTPDRLTEMDERGEIYWSPTGNPRRKIYLDESKGIPVQDIWMDFKDAHNQNIKITGYPTEKNPEMLKRIILASSNEGDLVLDAFAGSGTTVAAAEELNRNWIAIDNSLLAIQTMVHRFAKGTERMGDFVNKKMKNTDQASLFDDNRILQNGLDIYVEKSAELEPIDDLQVNEWRSLITIA